MNGKPVAGAIKGGSYVTLNNNWNKGSVVEINFPIELKLAEASEHATKPQGTDDIYRVNWLALVRGPLVYATHGLINGEDREKNFELSTKDGLNLFKPVVYKGLPAPGYALTIKGQKPLLFLPYYEAGGRVPGTWRLTWIQNKIN